MKINKFSLLILVIGIITTSGCSSYRTNSNIENAPTSEMIGIVENIIITEGSLVDEKYEEIGPIEVSVKKLTVFHEDPTKEQANEALREKAKLIGANAIINVTYSSGIGLTNWGYIDAKGIGVKVIE